jgi:hypothetical protein
MRATRRRRGPPATPQTVAAEILRLVELRVSVELTGRREQP